MTFAEVKFCFNVSGDKLSTQSRSFHDIHRSQEAGQSAHLRKRGTSFIFPGYSEPRQVELQQVLSVPCNECRLKPLRCDVSSTLFPSGYYAVNPLEALNILSYVEPVVHQGNGAFGVAMVICRLLLQFQYVQVVMHLEHD